MAYRGDARRRPLFPFLPGLRIIFGSAGIGIGDVLPIGTALVTEFAPTMIVMGIVGVALCDRSVGEAYRLTWGFEVSSSLFDHR